MFHNETSLPPIILYWVDLTALFDLAQNLLLILLNVRKITLEGGT